MMKIVKFFSVVFVVLCAVVSLSGRNAPLKQPEVNLLELVRSGAVIIDVRARKDYKKDHIAGAVNIEMRKLKTDHIPLDTGQVIITYCYMGVSSVEAVDILKKKGYHHVYNGGGINHLKKELGIK
jgi:rhodanese-related sulfurtransferase